MDYGGNMFCLSSREQNGNINANSNSNSNSDCHSFAWDSWETTTSNSSRLINAFHSTAAAATAAESSAANRHDAVLANALMLLPQASTTHNQQQRRRPAPYGGDGSHLHPDPHLMSLKLGKRHYFGDASAGAGAGAAAPLGGGGSGGGLVLADKRGKGGCYGGGGGGGVKAASFTAATLPRCQVDGCHVALLNAKDYHRRHKVCEMHSKAPKVVVLGMEQRFCQQCSRFHVVSEFDDSKRSCRRRLAGHNERRRKSSHDAVARNSSRGCALSLLSSRSDSSLSPADLSIRCSAALRELIAENRAAVMARQRVANRDWHLHHHAEEDSKVIQHESNYFPQQMFP